MTRLDKLWIALTSIGLASLIAGALGIATLIMLSGCAAKAATTTPVATVQPADPQHPEIPMHVYLPASVPGWWTFCVEDPLLAWPSEPNVIRRSTGWVCGLTVNDIRQWIAQQRRAD